MIISATIFIWIGNCLMGLASVSAKIVMINCSQPKNIGISSAALETSTRLNTQGDAIRNNDEKYLKNP